MHCQPIKYVQNNWIVQLIAQFNRKFVVVFFFSVAIIVAACLFES